MSIEEYLELYLKDRDDFERRVKSGEITEQNIAEIQNLFNNNNHENKRSDNKEKKEQNQSSNKKNKKSKSKSSKKTKKKSTKKNKTSKNRSKKNKGEQSEGIIKSTVKFIIKLIITIITISALLIGGYYLYMKYNSEQGNATNDITVETTEQTVLEDVEEIGLSANTYYTVGSSPSDISSNEEEDYSFTSAGEYVSGEDFNEGLYDITLVGGNYSINNDTYTTNIANIYLEKGDIITIEDGSTISLTNNLADTFVVDQGTYYFSSDVEINNKSQNANESIELSNGDVIFTTEETIMVRQEEVTETISNSDYYESCFIGEKETDCSSLSSYNQTDNKKTNEEKIVEEVTYIDASNIICSQDDLVIDCSKLYTYDDLLVAAKSDLEQKRDIVNIIEASFE